MKQRNKKESSGQKQIMSFSVNIIFHISAKINLQNFKLMQQILLRQTEKANLYLNGAGIMQKANIFHL
jgi:hypothetical protein